MRTTFSILIAGFVLLAATVPVAGHHAFGAEFDPNAPIRLQGKVVKLEWVNPHAWIHIEIKKPDGTAEVWMVEGGTPNTLLRRGLTRDSLRDGTELDRRRLSDQGSLAQARQRPRRHLHRRPQDVHGIVGHRRAERRPRSDREAEEAARTVRGPRFAASVVAGLQPRRLTKTQSTFPPPRP